MGYFEEKENIKYISANKKNIEERLYLIELKINIIMQKLNKKK